MTEMDCTVASCPQRGVQLISCPLARRVASDSTRSLVVASLDIGRVLADRGKVTFRAKGTCMFPCIQPGDILCIEARTIEQVQVGDIAVFKRGDALIGHRTIATCMHDGNRYIITRADRFSRGDDGPTYNDDVLGVVAAIERRGVQMPLCRQPLRRASALRAAAWERWNWDARPYLVECLGALQCHAWYRSVASVCLRLARTRLSFVVRVPPNAVLLRDLYREVSPGVFDVSKPSWQGRPITRWILALHINTARQPASTATFVWHPPECPRGGGWHVEELLTEVQYRGAGLEDALIRQAEVILARCGMTLEKAE